MAKFSYSNATGGLYIWEHDKEEPPSTASKILRVEGHDYAKAAWITKALNARHKWEKSLKKDN